MRSHSPRFQSLTPKGWASSAGVSGALLNKMRAGDLVHVMHSRRWFWLNAALSANRPLISQPNLQGQAGVNYGDVYGMGFAGLLPNGQPVVLDDNIAFNGGAGTNEDEIYTVARSECHLWEDPQAPLFIETDTTKAANLQLLVVVIPRLEALKKEGQSGQTKITQYTRYATVFICVIQAVLLILNMENPGKLFPGLVGARELTREVLDEIGFRGHDQIVGRVDFEPGVPEPGQLPAAQVDRPRVPREHAPARPRRRDLRGERLIEQVRAQRRRRARDVGANHSTTTSSSSASMSAATPIVIGNRVYNAYRKQCEFMLEDGAWPEEVDQALTGMGFAMGPFAVADLSGLDIAWRMRKAQAETRDPRERYVAILDRLCEQGRLGRKTGAGYYAYPDGKQQRSTDATVRAIIEQASAERGLTRQPLSPEQICRRALLAMVNEAALLLAEGVAVRASDIDVVLVQGYGFPRWEGGPVFWAQQQDRAELEQAIDGLAASVGHGFVRGDLARLLD